MRPLPACWPLAETLIVSPAPRERLYRSNWRGSARKPSALAVFAGVKKSGVAVVSGVLPGWPGAARITSDTEQACGTLGDEASRI